MAVPLVVPLAVAVSYGGAVGAVASTFLNISPAFGDAGPFGTDDIFPQSTNGIMIVPMWIERIEISPVLVLVTKSLWTS